MKSTIVLTVAFLATLAQARDLSQYTPNNIYVHPERPGVFNPRIVGGQEAVPHSFPHSAALYIDGGSFCGCSVISDSVILTAAHCVDSARRVEVVAGAHNINQDEPSQQSRISTRFVVHEDWDRNALINDIALVFLDEPLELNQYVQPINLDNGACDSPDLDGTDGTVSGWGRPSDSSGSISPVLRSVTNKLLTNAVCKSYFSIIRSTHICLDGSGGKGSCNGDSGGALLGTRDGNKVEVGIVSFGSGWGCEWGFPSAYTRVACYADWVRDQTR